MNAIVTAWSDQEIPSSAISLVMKLAKTCGIDADSMVDHRRVSTHASPPDREGFTALYRRCMTSACEAYSDHLSIVDTDLFLSFIVNCRNLEEVILNSIRFAQYCEHRGWAMELRKVGQHAILSFNAMQSDGSAIVELFGISGLYKLYSWLIGESLSAHKVTLRGDSDPYLTVLHDLLDCPTYHDHHANTIVFDKRLLRRPVIRTYEELIALQNRGPFELAPLPDSSCLSAQLESLFKKLLAERIRLPSVDDVAALLSQSSSTLRRNLARENTSFQALFDKSRRLRATELLTRSDMTIDRIADQLGFSAAGGFVRAFKEWTGVTPSVYRQQWGSV